MPLRGTLAYLPVKRAIRGENDARDDRAKTGKRHTPDVHAAATASLNE